MAKYVDCAYCGRKNVEVTNKGYMKPHMSFGGMRCIGLNIVERKKITDYKKKKEQ